MQFRIGINIGDVIYDDARIYGDGIKSRRGWRASPSPAASSFRARPTTRSKASSRFSFRNWVRKI